MYLHCFDLGKRSVAFSRSLLCERGKWVRYDLSCRSEIPAVFGKEYVVACCVKYSFDLSGRTRIRIPALGTMKTSS